MPGQSCKKEACTPVIVLSHPIQQVQEKTESSSQNASHPLSHAQGMQSLPPCWQKSGCTNPKHSAPHFGEMLLKGHAGKAACKAKGLYKISRDLNQPHMDQGQKNQAEVRGAAPCDSVPLSPPTHSTVPAHVTIPSATPPKPWVTDCTAPASPVTQS